MSCSSPRAGKRRSTRSSSAGARTRDWGPRAELMLSNSMEFLSNYVTGVLFSALLIGLAAVAQDFATPLYRLQKPIRALAGLTFTLYLFHYPLVYVLRALVLATGLEPFSPLVVTGGTFALV